MSDPANSSAPAPASSIETTINAVVAALGKALPAVELIVTALAPEAAGAIATAVAIAKGVAAGVPEAESLLSQFQSGTPPTQAQLDAYLAQENTAYETVMADIQAKLNAPA